MRVEEVIVEVERVRTKLSEKREKRKAEKNQEHPLSELLKITFEKTFIQNFLFSGSRNKYNRNHKIPRQFHDLNLSLSPKV